MTIKGGLDVRQSQSDNRTSASTFNFVGADGRASTTPAAAGSDDDAGAIAQLTLIDRGGRAEKEYLRFFPSLNASFNLREDSRPSPEIWVGKFYW